MKHYLYIIRKWDFTDLFKFGSLYIDVNGVVEFDGNLTILSQNIEIQERLFKRINKFDYSFESLLVYFISDLKNGKLHISEVQNIFALDSDAKREIENSYDKRIRIDNSIWPDAITKLQERFLYEDAKKGVQNLWKILKIEQPMSDVEAFFPSNLLREIAYEVQNDVRPQGDLSFWIYLLRYERHGYFPKNTAGFFMDLVNVYVNTIKGEELPAEVIETTEIYRKINEYQNLNMCELINCLQTTREGQNFFEKVDYIGGTKCNSFIIAILFLVYKNRFINGFNLSEIETSEHIKYGKRQYPTEFDFAIYLLGVFLGHSHTFDSLYEALPLPVFKTLSPIKCPAHAEVLNSVAEDDVNAKTLREVHKEFPKDPSIYDDLVEYDIEDQDDDLDKVVVSRVPKKVRKPGTKGNKGTKKVHNREEYESLLKQGFEPEPKYGYL